MTLVKLLSMVCCGWLICLNPASLFAADPTRPNIIFILVDDMGFSDLGCYGSEIDTPNLDRLASNGLRYTQFYNTARCWPTRSALLTGYYAQQIRRDKLPSVEGGGSGQRPPWARLLPDYLKPVGYRCYHSGKWHIDGPVLAGGFDRSLDMRNQGNYFSAKGNTIDDQPIVIRGDDSDYYATTATADHAIDCLKDHADHFPEQPFFQYIAFIAPHFPLHARDRDIAKYRGTYSSGWDQLRKSRIAKQQSLGIVTTQLSQLEADVGPPYHFPDALKRLGEGEVNRPLPWTKLTEQQKQFQATKMSIHAAMVDAIDQEVGRIVNQLSQMGVLNDTLLMFASDNGASAEIMVRDGGHDPAAAPGSAASYLCLGPGFSSASNTPFRRHKTWVHEGGISTPLIVHWPNGIADKNALRHTPAHLIDFVPTVLEITGVVKPAEWRGQPVPAAPGKSLLPTFALDKTIQRDCLWWLHNGNRALRTGDWKLVAAVDGDWELYDLASDRTEQNNLASQMPDKVAQMSTLWNEKANQFAALTRP